jgi:ATP-dependent Clp protease ATP-binding subunit ClpC
VLERFTPPARDAVIFSREEARSLRHDRIGTEHLLLGVLRVTDDLTAPALDRLDVTLERVRTEIARAAGAGEGKGASAFTPRAKKTLELSLREALKLGRTRIGPEHLVLGLMCEGGGLGSRILRDFGADAETFRNEVIFALGGAGRAARNAEDPTDELGLPSDLHSLSDDELDELTARVVAEELEVSRRRQLLLDNLDLLCGEREKRPHAAER